MIDLHTHTNKSDGELSPKELLLLAEKNKIEIFAISDHNNVNAYKNLSDFRNVFSGKIVPAVEFEFVCDGVLMDMLGYGIDFEKIRGSEIIKKGLLHSTVEEEMKNLNYYKSVCDKLGIVYSEKLNILRANFMANDVIVDDILKFKENKKILDDLGIFNRSTFYRKHVLNKESPFFIDFTKGKFDIFYVTKVIHDSGGKCFLAHPFVYGLDSTKDFLDYILALNIIDGIECYHRNHSKDQIDFLISYCEENNLLKSGGSDYHNDKHYLGKADNGNIEISKSLIVDWVENIDII